MRGPETLLEAMLTRSEGGGYLLGNSSELQTDGSRALPESPFPRDISSKFQ